MAGRGEGGDRVREREGWGARAGGCRLVVVDGDGE